MAKPRRVYTLEDVRHQLELYAEQLMMLADSLKSSGGRPLDPQEISLIRQAYLPAFDEQVDIMRMHYLAGRNLEWTLEEILQLARVGTDDARPNKK